MMPSNPLESSDTRLYSEVMFHVVYEDGDMEDMDFKEFIFCFKAASHPKKLLNDFGELRIWRVTCNMERPKTRSLIPFEGAGCNGVPKTATELDFSFAHNMHMMSRHAFREIRFDSLIVSHQGMDVHVSSLHLGDSMPPSAPVAVTFKYPSYSE